VKRSTAIFLLAALPIFMVRGTFALGQDRVRVGLSALSPTNWAVWVAEERGLLKKYGIDPQVIFIGGGSARGVNALVNREVQFMIIGGVGVIGSVLRGAELVMIASNVNLSTQRLMSRPDIKTVEDLRKKRVGVTAFGSNTHSVLLMLLRKWSMKPEEIVILQIGSSPTMVLSLEKGYVDAAVLTSPSDFIAEERGNRVLADLAAMKLYSLQSTLTTTRNYLRTNQDQAARFVRGYAEGIAFIKKNKTQSLEILRKKLRLDYNQDPYLQETYIRYSSRYLDSVPYVSVQGVRTLLEYLENQDPKARSADPQSFLDSSIVQLLENSGFFTRLYQ
jgi:ABC-type nitrate/sulfonate/bicarbonate transport system substrate-binding protein